MKKRRSEDRRSQLLAFLAAALFEFLAGAARAVGVAAGGLDREARLPFREIEVELRAFRGRKRRWIDVSEVSGGGDVLAADVFLVAVEFLRPAVELAEERLEIGGG